MGEQCVQLIVFLSSRHALWLPLAVRCHCPLSLCSHTENCVDQEGNTPLHLAVFCDNPQCMKLLLNHGAAVDASTLARTAVHVYIAM